MKVRIIRKPEFTNLHHVQIKSWWWPFWRTVAYEDLRRCEQIVKNLIEHGHAYTIIMQEKVK